MELHAYNTENVTWVSGGRYMKVAIIGNGNVGMSTFAALQSMREIHEIALCGRNVEKVQGEVSDYLDALVLRDDFKCRLTGGGYELTKGADILIYTAGVSLKPGQTRLELLTQNAEIVNSIFAEVNKYNQDAIIIVLSNPVDIITTMIQKVSGRPASKVIGSGTFLDTARLRRYLADLFDITPQDLNIYLLGEHGDSSVIAWSSFRVMGMSVDEYLAFEVGETVNIDKEQYLEKVHTSAYKLIQAKGFSAYGVAAAAAHLVGTIVNDTHEILPVSTVLSGEYGVNDMAISVPCLMGRNGILEVKQLKLDQIEKHEFDKSAKILKGMLNDIYSA